MSECHENVIFTIRDFGCSEAGHGPILKISLGDITEPHTTRKVTERVTQSMGS